jgi:nickel-dependent lactate racemase
MAEFLSRDRQETVPDQWQTQILLRILMHAKVIYVSDMDDATIEQMHMLPAHSLDEAIAKAKKMVSTPNPKITAIPDGVSVMVMR